MNMLFGIMFILAGIYLPIYTYRNRKEKFSRKLFTFTYFLEYGMMSIALGCYLVWFH